MSYNSRKEKIDQLKFGMKINFGMGNSMVVSIINIFKI